MAHFDPSGYQQHNRSSYYQETPPGAYGRAYRSPESPSLNMISDDFIHGYPHEGRMSAVRRFFCLFVTFDVVFIGFLWIISVVITGDNIYNALEAQVIHYTIYKSLFDVVIIAVIRFFVLIFFYAVLSSSHWIYIALSTTGSCAFLISKVFLYDFTVTTVPAFQVVLILTSFVLAWLEAWFLDGRVIPQERYALRHYNRIIQSSNERTPLLLPSHGNTESVFYSPYASLRGSDDGEDMDNEFRRLSLECVRKSYELLECPDWKFEKQTARGDRIYSSKREMGKVYRLTGTLKYSASALIYELFTKVEDVPKWNPTLLESKIIHKIDYFTDITYQASVGGGGGLVKSRDFVNLRCYRVIENGEIMSEQETRNKSKDAIGPKRTYSLSTVHEQSEGEGSSVKSEALLNESFQTQGSVGNSISGSGNFAGVLRGGGLMVEDERDTFSDCDKDVNRIYMSAARSVTYPGYPPSTKYQRGENIISCWATRDVPGHPNECVFEWLLCLDLKGYIMASVLDTAYKKLMQDYMEYLRKQFEERNIR